MSFDTILPTSREIELADVFRDEPILAPDRDRTVTGEKFRKMMSFDLNLDLKPALRKLDWGTKNLTPAQRILTDIYRHQKRFAAGKNEWVEIGVEYGFSITISKGKLAEIKDKLEIKGCIEIRRSKRYGTNNPFAYKYRFNEEFFTKAIIPAIEGEPVKLRRANKNRKPREIVTHSERMGLLQQVKRNSEMLIPDYEAIEAYVGEMNAGEAIHAANILAPFLDEHINHFVSEDRNGRIYSPYLQVHRIWRPYVYHKEGKVLVDIDIKTCHALLLYSLYSKYYFSFEDEKKEKRLFKRIIVHGDLYEFLRSKVNKYKTKRKYTRDEVKKYFNSFLNSATWCELDQDIRAKDFKEDYRAGRGKINEVGKVFSKTFPGLFERMKQEVAANLPLLTSKNSKPALGNGLMAMESKVLDPVYAELMAKDYFFIPCHDGVLVEADAKELTVNLILKSLEQQTGLSDKAVIKINKYHQ